jgi:glycerol-3-phosphate dehydrogenase
MVSDLRGRGAGCPSTCAPPSTAWPRTHTCAHTTVLIHCAHGLAHCPGRVLYLLPWEGSTIAGTTDGPGELTFEPRATDDDVTFILSEVNRVLRDKLDRSAVRAAWCGLRPLVRDPNADPTDTKKLSRHHVVDVVDGGLITIAGGKWTTYRKMAEDAVDKAIEIRPELEKRVTGDCVTSTMKLIGADRGGLVCHRNFDRVAINLREVRCSASRCALEYAASRGLLTSHRAYSSARRHLTSCRSYFMVDGQVYGMDKDVAHHLVHNYGTRALQLAEMAIAEPSERFRSQDSSGTFFWRRLSPQYPQLDAEVVFAVRHEYGLP